MMNENENAKAYELRALTADDVFPICQIISKIGIKEFKNCFENPDVVKSIRKGGKNDIESVGIAVAFDIAGVLMANLPNAKDSIYTFLSQISGMGKKDIATLPMGTFFEMIVDVVQKDEFKDFFQVVSKFLK